MADAMRERITAAGLGRHESMLIEHARPCVELVRAEAPEPGSWSRLGGAPDLPEGFSWPTHEEHGLYRFLGQLDLSTLPGALEGVAPRRGLLSLFFIADEEASWEEEGYVIAHWFEEKGALGVCAPPEEVDLGRSVALRLEAGWDLPPLVQAPGWAEQMSEEEQEAYGALQLAMHPHRGHLFGYPLCTTLAYDPSPGAGWRALLTLCSDEVLQWYWNDGDRLALFIEEARLARGDFHHLRADVG